MSLRDRILSDTNIYAAIHALPNTLREKSLICGDHQQYLKDLREVYRYGASHDKFISHCKDKLEKALDDELSEPFKVSFFLKFKDFEDGCAQYRPIHGCIVFRRTELIFSTQSVYLHLFSAFMYGHTFSSKKSS